MGNMNPKMKDCPECDAGYCIFCKGTGRLTPEDFANKASREELIDALIKVWKFWDEARFTEIPCGDDDFDNLFDGELNFIEGVIEKATGKKIHDVIKKLYS